MPVTPVDCENSTSVTQTEYKNDTSITYLINQYCDKVEDETYYREDWEDEYGDEQIKWLSHLHGLLKFVVVVSIIRHRVIKQPRPVAFWTWRYKR